MLTPPRNPKIRKISERKVYAKAIIYADPGVGKTWMCCTAPRALLLLTEPEISVPTIKAYERKFGVDIDTWDIDSLEELSEAFSYLVEGNHDYETVCIDSLTDIYRRIMRSAIDYAVSKRPSRDPDVPEQGDWFKVSEKIRTTVRLFRDLPMHVVFTTLAMDIKNEMKTVPFVQPKSLAQELPAFCNLVGYLAVKQDDDGSHVRKLLVAATDDYCGKNPGNALPPVVVNPNLTEIFKAMEHLKESDLFNA